ncbi:hypothetical protein DXD79_29445 [Hungatella hathewayi]|uniref:Uncharacterized protein n=1 Tax=Hungatella hathewayi TaxID=154046 RepID=A0A374NY23_9FIRM|nr:hypothetical protein DXD79_29445 [Hungatella hathewayi]RGK96677.1 hypothetical protein DXC88_12165 [Hungatella hathewayi]RHC48237.1 hypothetical protein DW841_17425 [Hungatella hathewayi]
MRSARGRQEQKIQLLLVSSVAGTKAGRQEKRADRANYGRNPEGFSLRVRLKAGFEACFHHPFFLPSCLSSCVPRKRKLLNLLLLPSPGAPQALGLCTGCAR